MSTITREFTKERLIEHLRTRIEHRKGLIASMHIDRGYRDYLKLELLSSEIALASLEAEAVGITDRSEIECLKRGEMANVTPPDYKGVDAGDEVYVYTAPPAPVSVPEPIKRNDADGWWMYKGRRVGGGCAEWYNRAIDDCRAAMLQGSEQPQSAQQNIPKNIPFEQWLSQQTDTIDVDCGCVTTEVFSRWLRIAYEDGNSPVIPEGWVACSERMPDADGNYWGWWSESKRQGPVWFIKSELQAQFQSSEITHWMPLPAAPQQEVKS